jgi:hypothetical protein
MTFISTIRNTINTIIDRVLFIKRVTASIATQASVIIVTIANRSYHVATDSMIGISQPTGRQRVTLQARFKLGDDGAWRIAGKTITL